MAADSNRKMAQPPKGDWQKLLIYEVVFDPLEGCSG
jgi:hypothetical protein